MDYSVSSMNVATSALTGAYLRNNKEGMVIQRLNQTCHDVGSRNWKTNESVCIHTLYLHSSFVPRDEDQLHFL